MLGMVVHTCNLRATKAGTRALWPVNLAELVSSRFSETVLNNKVKTDRGHLNTHTSVGVPVCSHIHTFKHAHGMEEGQEGEEGQRE